MKSITRIPIKDIVDVFGDPANHSDFVKLPMPFPMVASWDKSIKILSFYGHKHIAEAVIDALTEIKEYYGEKFIRENALDRWGGCFSNRQTVSGKRLSVHAWGLAVDYVPDLGKYAQPALTPYVIVNAFKKRNFFWGGDWSVPDGMHFSAIEE